MLNYFLVLVFFLFPIKILGQNTGNFWHISDQHLDPYYDDTATDPTEVCPSSYGIATPDAGQFGDYRCDSPWELINSSVHAMKKFQSEPDFIIWTGDDTLHTGDQEKYLGAAKVVEIVGNITELIKNVFPNTKVFPALGNHDFHPKSQIAPGGSDILTNIANLWKDWLSQEAYESFNKNGFYNETFGPGDQHVLIALNSNFWYDSNKEVDGVGDPGQEFEWMEDTLRFVKDSSKKAFIIGHVPPGYFELVSLSKKKWYYPEYNKRFNSIIESYADVIAGQFFGHHHSDTFKIFKNGNGETISSMLLTPGVTPWMTTLPGVVEGANNPGIRLFEYNKDTLALQDYTQYYLNLTSANSATSRSPDLWKIEYQATTSYNIPDISTASWGKIAENMRSGCESPSSECPSIFQKYVLHNSVSYNTRSCDEECQRFQLCAITEVDFDAYESCHKHWGSGGNVHDISPFMILLCGLLLILIQ